MEEWRPRSLTFCETHQAEWLSTAEGQGPVCIRSWRDDRPCLFAELDHSEPHILSKIAWGIGRTIYVAFFILVLLAVIAWGISAVVGPSWKDKCIAAGGQVVQDDPVFNDGHCEYP